MRIEVTGGIDDFEQERWVFMFDAGYLRLTLSQYFHETRESDLHQWIATKKPLPAELPAWVVIEARTNLSQRIDVTT